MTAETSRQPITIDKILPIVQEILKELTYTQEAIPETKSLSDMHLDSLDTVELIMMIEDRFEIEITDQAADQLLDNPTVRQIAEFVFGLKPTSVQP